jgi:GTP cyclohydrolase II
MAHTQSRKAEASPARRLNRLAAAADALRAGKPVRLGRSFTMLAAETSNAPAFQSRTPGWLVLSHARARTLKLRLYTKDVVALPLAGLDAAAIRAIADPTADLATPLKGPFKPLREKLPEAFAAAVKLAKLAGLLPAALLFKTGARNAVSVSPDEVFAYENDAAENLAIVTRARVPLEGAEDAELVAFRAGDGHPENYAILIGKPATSGPVLTRLHSECFTGDLLFSLKCDCGAQLRGAIAAIAKNGSGVLLYLAQEGRGIGLINKLRAYRLQDQGFDTLEANQRLGFLPDERIYAVAAKMLKLLGFRSVRLLTNNPEKVKGLKAAGIKVVERVPHAFPASRYNRAYLAAKAKAGHWL